MNNTKKAGFMPILVGLAAVVLVSGYFAVKNLNRPVDSNTQTAGVVESEIVTSNDTTEDEVRGQSTQVEKPATKNSPVVTEVTRRRGGAPHPVETPTNNSANQSNNQTNNTSTDNSSSQNNTPAPTWKKGDVTRDGRVDLDDVEVLGKAYGSKVGDARFVANADLNGNGEIDFNDLAEIAQNFDESVALTSKVVFGGDTNQDGSVDFIDLAAVAQSYNSEYADPVYGNSIYKLKSDFNLDGKVNHYDLAILARNYNTTGPVPAPRIEGDVTGDGVVNFDDVAKYAQSAYAKVGQGHYNRDADVDSNGLVDVFDLAKIRNSPVYQ